LSAAGSAEASWPAESATVPASRRFVREYVARLGRPELADDAELVVTELVSNVVLHVGGTVRVTASSDDGQLLLEVTDDSRVPPQVRAFSATSSTGRGMRLVHSLSVEHGIRVTSAGKTIWARLTTATARRTDADVAESFADVDWLAQLADVDGLDGRPSAWAPLPLRALAA